MYCLGPLADALEEPIKFSYDTIPNFPVSTVQGHAGELVFGYLNGVPVICMKGRFHYYEGYPLWKCAMPVRIMKLCGITHLITTNAAGGVNPCYKLGDIMIIKDHINMMGFAGNNPLQGPNEPKFGTRFPPMNQAYDKELIQKALKIGEDLGIQDILHEGVYSCVGGPNFETVAELRMLKTCGVDAIGMSTVHEVIVAKHCDLKVFGFSLITNEGVLDYETHVEPNHQEVMAAGKSREELLQKFVAEMIKEINP